MSLSFFPDLFNTNRIYNGYDLFWNIYQMVPTGGQRRMIFGSFSDEEELFISIHNSSAASIVEASMHVVLGLPPGKIEAVNGGFVVHPGTWIKLIISGGAPGYTLISAGTKRGRGVMRAVMILAVKPRRVMSFTLCVLSDARHLPHPDFSGSSFYLKMALLKASELLEDQCNVELSQSGSVLDVRVIGDLGTAVQVEQDDTLKKINHALTNAGGYRTLSHRYIFACWGITARGTNFGGYDPFNGRWCFINNQYSTELAGQILAHELCHSVGLGHTQDEAPLNVNEAVAPFLMTSRTGGSGTYLHPWQIEKITEFAP